MKNSLVTGLLVVFLAATAQAAPVTLSDFDAAATVGDTGFGTQESTLVLVPTGAINGSQSIEATSTSADGFANLLGFFGSPVLLEAGGTLTGDAVFTNVVDPGIGTGPSVFVARSGTVTGFDLTDSDDNDDNFNFTGPQTVNTPFSFSFEFPEITGTNGVDSGGFYGLILGANNVTAGDTIQFDNIVFTPTAVAVPEPTTMAGLALIGGVLAARRRRR